MESKKKIDWNLYVAIFFGVIGVILMYKNFSYQQTVDVFQLTINSIKSENESLKSSNLIQEINSQKEYIDSQTNEHNKKVTILNNINDSLSEISEIFNKIKSISLNESHRKLDSISESYCDSIIHYNDAIIKNSNALVDYYIKLDKSREKVLNSLESWNKTLEKSRRFLLMLSTSLLTYIVVSKISKSILLNKNNLKKD